MKEYIEIIKNMAFGQRRFIKYQLGVSLLIALFIVPGMRRLLSICMSYSGYDVIVNESIPKFICSAPGILYSLIMVLLIASILLINLGGLILMSHSIINKKNESSFLNVFITSISRMKNFFCVGGIVILLYGVFIISSWNIFLASSIRKTLTIPNFILSHIESSTSLIFVFYGLIIISVIFLIKWSFSLHYIMLKNYSAKEALKQSNKLVLSNFIKIIKKTIKIIVIDVILTFIIVATCLVLGIVILKIGLFFSIDEKLILGLLSVIGSGLIIIEYLVIGPFHVLCTTKLFLEVEQIDKDYLKPKTKESIVLRKLYNSKVIRVTTCVIVLLFSISAGYAFDSIELLREETQITAHRGSSLNAPENTMSAIEMSIKEGADFVEIDVQRTRDNIVILFHDYNMKRVMNLNGKVEEFNLQTLKSFDIGSWYSDRFSDERISTLEEVIKETKGKIHLNIEIKSKEFDQVLIEETVKLIEKYNLIESCVVTSLKQESLFEVERLNERIKTGYVVVAAYGDLETINVDFYSVEASRVNENFVKKAHENNREVHVWTVNNVEEMHDMIALNVDNIITDNVDILVQIRNKKYDPQ